jgi:hypothetical protein
VPLDLHTRTKAGCAARGVNVTDLIREFLGQVSSRKAAVKPVFP